MCVYTHQFTKCGECTDIIYEDNPVTQKCAGIRKGGDCTGRHQEVADTVYIDKEDCASCIKKEEERVAREEARKKAKK
jgi:hypothetical protein